MGALAPTILREKVSLSNCRKKILGMCKNSIKAELLQLNRTQFPSLGIFVRPTKIMNRADKNWAHF